MRIQFIFLCAAFTGMHLMAAATCESLKSLALPNATITMARLVPAGPFTVGAARGGAALLAEVPSFCRVAATLKPSSDSDIKIEVWLPTSHWNGKFEGTANMGYAGSVLLPVLAEALRRGYAAASTDTGHAGGSGSFADGHPERITDFADRAVHEMTVKSKQIITAFYGSAPKRSYFVGCSTGGRQGLKEAQAYPDDYDSIVVGAPANNMTHMTAWQLAMAQAVHKDEASFIPAEKFPLIHKAALEACDAIDGVKDGVAENPMRCKFDPQAIECKPGADPATCLSAPQVEVARRMYAADVNPKTKQYIFPGLERGSELGWGSIAGKEPQAFSDEFWKYLLIRDPKWDYKTLSLEAPVPDSIVDATDPNLKAFFAHNGKLLQYHGWSDPVIAPQNSINYYKKVLDTLGGAKKLDSSYRLFMVPGMAHCGGGEGTSTFDMLAALEQWTEQGKAPDQIAASKMVNGKAERTRPLCPYPAVATYKGNGSTDDAANFACKAQ